MSAKQKRRIAENYSVIWMDDAINKAEENWQKKLAQVQGIINDVKTFTQPDECIQFLKSINLEKVFLVASGILGQDFVPNIHDIPQLHSIYILCPNKESHKEWAQNWAKIKGVHRSIKSICKKLQMAVKQCNQNNTTISIIGVNEGVSNQNLNQLKPSFMYAQILKKILCDLEQSQQGIKDMIEFCQAEYEGNLQETKVIEEFKRTYKPSKAIWWYT
ncbi:unnamed protein product, partial [Rotaria sp. Silwood2]